jgi:uncharacterized membrane protein YidH (DUF202 family)
MRFGFAAKGFVYAIIGILALQAALGSGGKTTDTSGALQTILNRPFGQILLALVAVGLIGYALWRWVQAFWDPENKGSDAQGLAKRLGYAVNGLIYAGIAFSAAQLILGRSSGGGSEQSTQHWTAVALSQPFGRWLVGLAGALVIGFGFYEFYKAYQAKFRKQLKTHQMSPTEQSWATRVGRLGLAARGVTFIIIGWFLIQASLQAQAKEARGLGGALEALAQQPYGPWLLGIVAVGLIAYGVHMGFLARYRRMQVPHNH